MPFNVRPRFEQAIPTQTDELAALDLSIARSAELSPVVRSMLPNDPSVAAVAARIAAQLERSAPERTSLVSRVALKLGVPAPATTQVTQTLGACGDTVQFGIEFVNDQVVAYNAEVRRSPSCPSWIELSCKSVVCFDILLPGAGIYLAVFFVEGALKVSVTGWSPYVEGLTSFHAFPTLTGNKLLVPFESGGGVVRLTLLPNLEPNPETLRMFRGEAPFAAAAAGDHTPNPETLRMFRGELTQLQ